MKNWFLSIFVVVCLFIFAFIPACSTMNTNTGAGISSTQAQAGADYLESTVTVLQKALDAAKVTGDPEKVATAQGVLDKAKAASDAFKASINPSQGQYDVARGLITTAFDVLAPMVMQAIVGGS